MTDIDWSVAIIIPAFNRERFIGAAIESALAQTLPADEIIVVDDGSTDHTVEIVERYPPPVRLIRIENNGAGPSRPRNVAIAAARSKYITLLDSDDRLAPTVLERHRQILRDHPDVGLVCNNYQTACQSGNELTQVRRNQATVVHSIEKQEIAPASYLIRSSVAYASYCSGNFIKTPGTTVPKAVWKEVGRFDETLRTSNDYDFFIRVLAKCDVVYIDEALETIVYHDANISAANLTRRFVPEIHLNHIRVLRREFRKADCAEHQVPLRASIQATLVDLAYGYREARCYSSAASAYLRYIHWGGKLGTALTGISKVAACCLLDLLGRPHRPASSADRLATSVDTPD